MSPPRYTGDNVIDPVKLERVTILGGAGDTAAAARAQHLAEGVRVCKDVVNAPPNSMTPSTMAGLAKSIAAESGGTMECKVLDVAQCEALGMGSYLGVSQGSSAENAAHFIHLTYTPPSGTFAKKVALVGKGLTFDSGG